MDLERNLNTVFNASAVTFNNESLCCMFIEVSVIIEFLGNRILCLINSGQDLGDHQNRPCSKVCFCVGYWKLRMYFLIERL